MYVIATNHKNGVSYWTGYLTGFGSFHRAIKYDNKKVAAKEVTDEAKRWMRDKGFILKYYPNYGIPYVKKIQNEI